MNQRIGIPECLVILAPWTIAIQVQFGGLRPLQIVGFALLWVSFYRRSLSRLNRIAHGIIALVMVSFLWALILSISAQDRTLTGESGVLSEIDNALTPVLWIAAAAYVGLLPAVQRERQVGLLMRSMLAFAAVNFALQCAQQARLTWSWGFLVNSESVGRLIVSAHRAPGFFYQCTEAGFFVAIMTALVVTHVRASAPLRATALLLLLATGIAAGDKTPIYALIGILLISIKHTWKLVPVLIIGTLVIFRFMDETFVVASSWFTSNRSIIDTMSNGRFGATGLVQAEVTRLLSLEPLGLGYGSKVAGLVYWAYDSELLQAVAIMGFWGLAYLVALITLLCLGAWQSDQRRQAYSLLFVFAIAAQEIPATSANFSAAFFWLAFTMIALLSRNDVPQPTNAGERTDAVLIEDRPTLRLSKRTTGPWKSTTHASK